MRLYIVRHGIAVAIGEHGVKNDRDRMLSAAGHRKTQRAAQGLRCLRCNPPRIVSSPLLRAVETADILARVLGCNSKIDTTDVLEPEKPAEEVIRWLRKQPRHDMTLVGHLPSLEYLVAALLGGDAPVKVRLRKAGVCAIDFDTSPAAGAGRLEWLLQPRQLRLLGKNGTSA